MVRSREPGLVHADFGHDDLRGDNADTRDLIEAGHSLRERGHLLIDRGLHQVDVRVDAVDPGQHGPQEEPHLGRERVDLVPSRS